MKNYNNRKEQGSLINEMRNMLDSMPKLDGRKNPHKKRGLLEGLVYGEDGEEMEDNAPEQPISNGRGQMDMDYMNDGGYDHNEEEMDDEMGGESYGNNDMERKENPLDGDPDVAKAMTQIMNIAMKCLQKLGQDPNNIPGEQYQMMKKIWDMIEKAIEDKMNPEEEQVQNQRR